MEELTVGDIRPLLTLVANNPLLDDSGSIASQLRSLLTATGVPITGELAQALDIIEQNPVLIDAGVAEFRAAIESLPDSTLLSEVPGFAGSVGGGDGGSDGGDDGGFDIPVTVVDADGNEVVTYTLPFSGTTISVSGDNVTVSIPGQDAQVLSGLDRIEFTDGTYFLDVEDGPGVLKGAYDALLGRGQPDAEGFDFWLGVLESNAADLFDLTEAFVQTDSFAEQYGALLNNAEDLLNEIYINLFNRVADQPGLAFWSNYLESNGVADTVDEALAYMLQSDEFQTLIGTTLDDGFFV